MTTNGSGNETPLGASHPVIAPTVPIHLDKPRSIKFDLNALASLEDVTGENTLDPATWEKDPTASRVRAFLWAGLLHEDPDLTLRDVGAWIHPGNMQDIFQNIQTAAGLSLVDQHGDDAPADNDQDGDDADPLPPGVQESAGSSSGRTGDTTSD